VAQLNDLIVNGAARFLNSINGIITSTGGLEVKGHIAGDTDTTGHGLWGGGGYHNAYNSILLHGDASTGSSGIAFVSDKITDSSGTVTNINQPSDRAFIQYHACGITTATAEGTNPTLATSGEAGRLVIGIGNDAADQLWLQTPSHTSLIHQTGASSYVIPDTGNTSGTIGSATQPMYSNAGVLTACTYTLEKSVPSNAVFTDTNNAVTQTATTANAYYEVLFSATADNTTRTESARKNSNLVFNPSVGLLSIAPPASSSAFPAGGLMPHDVRDVAHTPATLDRGVNFFFSNNTMPNSNWWAGMYCKGWSGAYSAWELVGPAINADARTTALYVRTSNTNSAWGSWRKIYDTSNPPTASEVGALPLSGGTMNNGAQIVAKTNDTSSSAAYNGGIQLREYNAATTSIDATIYNAPGISFHWGGKWANKLSLFTGGNLYWGSNPMASFTQSAPTSGQVVITDGTTGGVKSSGYTIATSVPSGAKFTDTTYTASTGLSLSGTAFSVNNSGISPYEANLQWGGKNFAGSFGCLDAAMIDELGANRFMFLKAAGITIEYTRNAGSSWTDYGATDAQKIALFSQGNSFIIGKADSTNKATANGNKYQLRITIDTGAAGVYTVLNKFVIYISTNGSASSTVTIQKALQSTPTTYTDVVTDIGISGWSGYNVINVSAFTTYGNTAATQYGRVRFIFKANGGNTDHVGLNIAKIMAFGGMGWTTPSTMARTGHLYAFDQGQNATFPANVTATKFIGALQGNADTATKVGTSTVGGTTTPIYLNAGVPTALSYTIAKSVPANAVFTDSSGDNKLPLAGGSMTGASGIQFPTAGGNNKSGNWISAGGGYGNGSGKNGVKLISCEQSDCVSGIGQDLSGIGGYDTSIVAAESTGGVAHISFVKHTIAAPTTYTRLGYFNSSGNFYATGTINCTNATATYTYTKTSGTWTVGSASARRVANVVHITLSIKGTGTAVNVGTAGFVGKIAASTNAKLPALSINLIAYYNSAPIICNIDTSGNVNFIPMAGGASEFTQRITIPNNTEVTASGTFVCVP
jgi:hypothetical protein